MQDVKKRPDKFLIIPPKRGQFEATRMKPELIRIGMSVRYQNQKWVGKVISNVSVEAGIPEVQVKFPGENSPERIEVDRLNPAEVGAI